MEYRICKYSGSDLELIYWSQGRWSKEPPPAWRHPGVVTAHLIWYEFDPDVFVEGWDAGGAWYISAADWRAGQRPQDPFQRSSSTVTVYLPDPDTQQRLLAALNGLSWGFDPDFPGVLILRREGDCLVGVVEKEEE